MAAKAKQRGGKKRGARDSIQAEPHRDDVGPGVGRRESLEALLRPRSLAVVGASDARASIGSSVFANLIAGSHGLPVYAVNPNHKEVQGHRSFRDLASLPEPVDLALIATCATRVPEVVRDCIAAGVRGATILSSGFRETGAPGTALETEIQQLIRGSGLRVLGPNSFGIMNPVLGLNASFAAALPETGSVGFISQSGALGSAILDWSGGGRSGFSAFVSVGSMLDVGWGDVIRELGNDPHTKSIVIYMESIGEARSFLSAAREVALSKPIIVLKAGATKQAARVVAANTGSEVGSDEVFDAALRRVGVLRVHTISSLFYMADILSKQAPPRGRRLTILTNASGPAALATDALIAGGGELAELSDETFDALDELLPVPWSHANPIDVLGDADAERYARAIEIAGENPDSDGLLVILTPQSMTDPTHTADALATLKNTHSKPVLGSWIGGHCVAEGVAVLQRSGIPTFPYPDTAAHVFTDMWRYSYSLRGLYETPEMDDGGEGDEPDRERVAELLEGALANGDEVLDDDLVGEILREYGIPMQRPDRRRTRKGPPLRISSSSDSQFGPVLALEIGDVLPDVHIGRAVGLPPLNTTLARRLLERSELCDSIRAAPGCSQLETGLVRFGRLISEQWRIKQAMVDLHHAASKGWIACEAEIRLHPAERTEQELPRPAIRPYPVEWVTSWTTKSGKTVSLRPIRPEDEPLMVEFHGTLSDESVYSRYLGLLGLERRIEHDRLTRLCFIDYDREIALVVDWQDPETGEHRIRGVARLVRLHGGGDAEYAILLSDSMQGEGLGYELMRRLVEVAELEGIEQVVGEVLPANRRMLRVCRRLGFEIHPSDGDHSLVTLRIERRQQRKGKG